MKQITLLLLDDIRLDRSERQNLLIVVLAYAFVEEAK